MPELEKRVEAVEEIAGRLIGGKGVVLGGSFGILTAFYRSKIIELNWKAGGVRADASNVGASLTHGVNAFVSMPLPLVRKR